MFGTRRNLFMYETPGDQGGAAPAGPGGQGDYQRVMDANPVPAGDPGDPGGGAPAGAPAGWQPTEEWGGRIDSFIQGAEPVLSQLAEILAQPDGGYEQQPGYDPYQPDPNVPMVYQPTGDPAYDQWQVDYINWQQQYGGQQQQGGFDPSMIQQAVEQAMAPYTPMMEAQAQQQGEAYARQALDDIKAEVGDFDQEQAITVAQAFMAQGYDAQTSLAAAARHVHDYEEGLRTQAIDAYKATLQRQAEAGGDLGAGGSALETPGTPTGRGRYEEAVQRHLSGVQTIG